MQRMVQIAELLNKKIDDTFIKQMEQTDRHTIEGVQRQKRMLLEYCIKAGMQEEKRQHKKYWESIKRRHQKYERQISEMKSQDDLMAELHAQRMLEIERQLAE